MAIVTDRLPKILINLSPKEVVNYLQNNPNIQLSQLEVFLVNLIDRMNTQRK